VTARTCTVAAGGHDLAATWALTADSLLLTPSAGAARAVLLRDIEGIGGDDGSIELTLGPERITLSRLGAEATALRDDLVAAWLPARAAALRLAGEGQPVRFSGTVAFREKAPVPFAALLYPHAVLLAPQGSDLSPLFLAEVEALTFDADRWVIMAQLWGCGTVSFGKLGGRTDEIREALTAARAALAEDAAATLARWLPTLPTAARGTLASRWLPGRFLPLADLEAQAPGAAAALFTTWVAPQPRAAQGTALQEWAAAGTVFAGYTTRAGSAELWLLARRDQLHLLECLSREDWATYRLAGGKEVPELAGRLLCAPQFSREALYLPLEELSGERGDYAVAARSLPFLRELRQRFRGRIIHREMAAWRAALDAP